MPDDTTRTRDAGLLWARPPNPPARRPDHRRRHEGWGTEGSAREAADTKKEGRGASHPSQLPTTSPEPAEPNAAACAPGTRERSSPPSRSRTSRASAAPSGSTLRPITLLFGRNSAGKSTILHALCYAHEILSHRNTDPHKLELGGDQVDLGGFRRFVHGHDLDRVVRLRFELSLDGWRVPDRLVRVMIDGDLQARMDEAMDEIPDEWFEARAPSGFARSGWVTLAVKWDQPADRARPRQLRSGRQRVRRRTPPEGPDGGRWPDKAGVQPGPSSVPRAASARGAVTTNLCYGRRGRHRHRDRRDPPSSSRRGQPPLPDAQLEGTPRPAGSGPRSATARIMTFSRRACRACSSALGTRYAPYWPMSDMSDPCAGCVRPPLIRRALPSREIGATAPRLGTGFYGTVNLRRALGS